MRLVFNLLQVCAGDVCGADGQEAAEGDSHTAVVLVARHPSDHTPEFPFEHAHQVAFHEFPCIVGNRHDVAGLGSTDNLQTLHLGFGYDQWHIDNPAANVSVRIVKS